MSYYNDTTQELLNNFARECNQKRMDREKAEAEAEAKKENK